MPHSPESFRPDISPPNTTEKNSQAVSRRTFLKLAAAGSLATLTGQKIAEHTKTHQTDHTPEQPDSHTERPKEESSPQTNEPDQTQPPAPDENAAHAQERIKQEQISLQQELICELALHPEYNYWETLKEQGLMTIAKTVANHVFERLGIPHGNANVPLETVLERLKSVPIETALASGVGAPVVEELAMRLIPSVLLAGKDGSRWDVGIPVAALFAFAHNFNKTEILRTRQITVSDKIPVTQFMGGLFYWHLMREKGVDHAILAHITNNAGMSAVAKLLYELHPPAGEGFVEFTHGKIPSKKQTEGDSHDQLS